MNQLSAPPRGAFWRRSPHAARLMCGLAMAVMTVLAACSEPVQQVSETSAIQATGGGSREGELFGNIYVDGVRINRATTNYRVELTPLGSTNPAARLGARWNPEFNIQTNTSDPASKDWEWYDEDGDGQECLSDSPVTEQHDGEPSVAPERHCIVPGQYRVDLYANETLVRSIDIEYFGGKATLGVERVTVMPYWDPNRNSSLQWRLADESFTTGMYNGSLWAYRSGDTQVNWDLGTPNVTVEPNPVVTFENVGRLGVDTVRVPLINNHIGPTDILRVGLSDTPGAYKNDPGMRLFRLFINDAGGIRPIGNFFSAYSSLYSHVRQIDLQNIRSGGCPQIGIQTLLPDENPGTTHNQVWTAGIVWKPMDIHGVCGSSTLPDLVMGVTTYPTGLPSSGVAPITVNVSNTGTTASQATNYAIFLSTDQTLDWADSKLTTPARALPSIQPGQSFSETIQLAFPYLAAPSMYLIAVADGDRQIEEPVRANNLLVSSSIPVVTTADLILGNYTPPSVALGTSFSMPYVESNIGGQTAHAPWTDRFYLSADGVLNRATDTLFATNVVSQDETAGQILTRYVTLTADPTLTVGVRRLIGSVDDDNVVQEPNEVNNYSTSPTINITYASGLDIAATQLEVTHSANGYSFRYMMRNIGTNNISCINARVRLYLSSDQLVSTNDYRTAVRLFTPCPTASGATSGISLPEHFLSTMFQNGLFQFPPPGTYYLLLKADSENSLSESNEGNNVMVGSMQIVLQ